MISWNWNPDKVAFVDIETQSAANLRQVGSRRYLRDPSTRLMSAVLLREDSVILWIPPDRAPGGWQGDLAKLWPEGFDRERYHLIVCDSAEVPEEIAETIAEGYTFCAHNATFDATGWALLIGGQQPSWTDTLPCARAGGLPGSLDAISQRFLGRGKDEGKEALKLLYTAKVRNGRIAYTIGTVPLWQSVCRYNVADVLLLERIWQEVGSYGESDVLTAHSAIDERGVLIDGPYLARLRELWGELQEGARDRFESLLDEDERGHINIRSVPQMLAWLRKRGLNVDSLNRKELERLYADPLGYFDEIPEGVDISRVIDLLRARQTATRISTGKIDRLLDMVASEPDSRARGVLVYWGAHTGRWTGRGFQPHNLARGIADLDVEGCCADLDAGTLTLTTLAERTAKCKPVSGLQPTVDDALSTLLRPAICAKPGYTLAIVDYASVEARGIAWIADQHDLLTLFREGRDTYCEMASRIFGRLITKEHKEQRQIGKIVVLGCGYGMGAEKFKLFCDLQRVDLHAAGTTAEACIDAYRDAFPAIAGVRVSGQPFRNGGVWKALEHAAREAITRQGRKRTVAGKCAFEWVSGRLEIELPSGRKLVYRDARLEPRVPGYARLQGAAVKPKPTIVYTHHHGYEGYLYGGLIAENVVQAICRDLLATALVRCESEGIPVVLHVHDEIVAEVPGNTASRSLQRLAEIMSDPPEWAQGFPIGVEGFTCVRYVKSAWRGAWHVEGACGKVEVKWK